MQSTITTDSTGRKCDLTSPAYLAAALRRLRESQKGQSNA
jgi:hypothetical protein